MKIRLTHVSFSHYHNHYVCYRYYFISSYNNDTFESTSIAIKYTFYKVKYSYSCYGLLDLPRGSYQGTLTCCVTPNRPSNSIHGYLKRISLPLRTAIRDFMYFQWGFGLKFVCLTAYISKGRRDIKN